jgi:hypothetical protein
MNDTLALSHRTLHDSGGCESPVSCEWLQCQHGMGLYVVDEGTAETIRTILWSAVTRNDTQGITPPHGSSECNTVPQTGLPMRAGLAHTPVNRARSHRSEGSIPCLPARFVHSCSVERFNEAVKINLGYQTRSSFPIASAVCTYTKKPLLPGPELVPL